MIKKIICDFEDVKEWQKFKTNGREYIKVPRPKIPFRITVLKKYDTYMSEGEEDFSPNAYNLDFRKYAELENNCECVIECADIRGAE